MNFQDKLRQYREQAGYKQAKDFAEKIGIPYTTYLGYENQGREPKYELLCKIATALNCTTDELLGREKHVSYYELRCMQLENQLKKIASIASDM